MEDACGHEDGRQQAEGTAWSRLRQPSAGTTCPHLGLRCQPPELGEDERLLLKLPCLCCYVTAAPVGENSQGLFLLGGKEGEGDVVIGSSGWGTGSDGWYLSSTFGVEKPSLAQRFLTATEHSLYTQHCRKCVICSSGTQTTRHAQRLRTCPRSHSWQVTELV